MKTISLYKLNLITFCFLLGTLFSFSQNEHIDWSAQSYLVGVNGTEVELNNNLTKQGTNFTWVQNGYNNTSETSSFNISLVTGNWNTSDNTGEIQYDLTTEDSTASLIINGNAEGIIVVLSINDVNEIAAESYTFYIESLTNL
ncbi:hypothetical protein [uncultured Winogradskyella sp.]|uniref:hypothetical protein n=1 Tax=uncultured Winogradskyella sp. TaxID=395353 RepID=UPI002637076B|nr:hypothetical protein [uncultured Winogradskyella sp.]